MWHILVPLLVAPSFGLRTFEPPPPPVTTRNNITEHWFTVRLNHFMAHNNETFQMRFYYNNEFVNASHIPEIVVFVGGEWAIYPGWVGGGLAHELASILHAGLFYTEHRYYGLTRPTANTTVSELRYLNVDQALADLAQFIEYVKSEQFENGIYRNSKVVLVGCSYAGSMATWMRLAYPHLVDAVFSDSGPLHAQEDFPEYLEVITEALRTQGSEECLSSVSEAVQLMVELLETEDGAATISSLFNTCSPIDTSSEWDIPTFFWYGITETFAALVQYATPGNIPAACAVLTNSNISDPVQRLANWITAQSWTQPCIESRYSEVVTAHTNTDYDSPNSVMRLWTYQTCVEYGWYQTTTSSRQPFLSTVPLEYFHQMCKDFYSIDFDEVRLRQGIVRTNNLFAGLTHLPDYSVSVAGGHDPWSPMGPNVTHATALASVYVVPGVSHCRAITATGNSDTEELERVKQAVLSDLHLYITGIPLTKAANVAVPPLVLIVAVTFAMI
ncbi:putative serine protease K12H4.7 isoform X2 [Galleria mellonella]|uniref:Serine protease K12H4.7 isoform X2 n=1 Tax=Galleria mellonella TaxID=7137 RepID=A0ABM3M8D6_GALME|nr:putative serine protease K12H4.7 isoform X2 [Galleria mellonella]